MDCANQVASYMKPFLNPAPKLENQPLPAEPGGLSQPFTGLGYVSFSTMKSGSARVCHPVGSQYVSCIK